MVLKIRVVGACVLGLLFLAASASAIDDIVIAVRSSEWGTEAVQVRRGHTVTWKWESGHHTIMLGEADDPEAVEIGTVDETHPTLAWEASDRGEFHFFSKQNPDIDVTVTVQANTSVNEATWGWLKRAFEGPAARMQNR
jgi:plastocyanin